MELLFNKLIKCEVLLPKICLQMLRETYSNFIETSIEIGHKWCELLLKNKVHNIGIRSFICNRMDHQRHEIIDLTALTNVSNSHDVRCPQSAGKHASNLVLVHDDKSLSFSKWISISTKNLRNCLRAAEKKARPLNTANSHCTEHSTISNGNKLQWI